MCALIEKASNNRVQGTLHKVSGPLTRDVLHKKMKNAIILIAFVATLAASNISMAEATDKGGVIVSGELSSLKLAKIKSIVVFPPNAMTLEDLFRDLGGFTVWSFHVTIIKKDGTRVFFIIPKYDKDLETRKMSLDEIESIDVGREVY